MSESSIFLGLSATAAIFKLADFLAEFFGRSWRETNSQRVLGIASLLNDKLTKITHKLNTIILVSSCTSGVEPGTS